MADVFSEVEEGLRQDRYRELFKRFAPWGAGAAAVLIAIVGGREFMSARQAGEARAGAELYVTAEEAVADGDLELARAAFAQLAEEGNAGYAYIAAMRQATLALETGQSSEASALFESAAGLASDPVLRDAALLKGVYAALDTAEYENVRVRLTELGAPDRPLHLAAREALAAAAFKAGDLSAAEREYRYVSLAPETPQNMRQRASEALAVIAGKRAATAVAPEPSAGEDERNDTQAGDTPASEDER